MSAEHTQGKVIIDSMPLPSRGFIRITGNCEEICRVYKEGRAKYYKMPPKMEANARHIVKCVNLHDELVRALKSACDNLRVAKSNTRMEFPIIKYIEKTIAKAEEG